MKHNHFTSRLLGVLLLVGAQVFAQGYNPVYLLGIRLNGANHTPPVSGNGVGAGSVVLDLATRTAKVDLQVSGLTGAVQSSHIHDGLPGVNGGVVFDLGPISGNRFSKVLNNLTAEQIRKFLTGGYYVNVHTAANPGGEIRGQIIGETDKLFVCEINGANHTPPVSTSADGLGIFSLSANNKYLRVYVSTAGLSGTITAAHLHSAPAGSNGGVQVDLTDLISGNQIIGTKSLTPAQISLLQNDSLYINIHTAANPGGEIRGQLRYLGQGLHFSSQLSGDSHTPPVATNGKGVAHYLLTPGLDTLFYRVHVNGQLSGAITAAHIHKGLPGTNGGVVHGFQSSEINGNNINGIWTGSSLNAQAITDLMNGSLYLNIHTAANPGGELRSQLNREARLAFTYNITGNQEVPAVTTSATGYGWATMDRNRSNIKYLFAVDGLTVT
ncbi:MAG: CHRD domain-containing protein, partial [Bacteroidia bacterium]|nr:CHRD domain-containing protein [Bacteroidia bacterium]